jgi:RNA polymerase sigma-70 factor (ECF subfamily)
MAIENATKGPSSSSGLARYRAGPNDTFIAAFEKYGSTVLRYALRIANNSADAEELVQETFVTAWAKRKSIDLTAESLLPWLLVTCRNHAANLRRKNRRNEADELNDDTTHVPALADADDLVWIRDEIAAMSEPHREICRLCLIEGMPYREAADRLNVSTSMIAKRIQRARTRLKLIRSETI